MSGSSLIKFLKRDLKKMTWPGFSLLCWHFLHTFAEQLNVLVLDVY